MQLPKLKFDVQYDFKIRRDKDKFFIYDVTRKCWLVLTPEEWVRQHWIHYYIFQEGYSASAIISEQKVELNGTTKRLDLLITEKTEPKVIIECKAPHITLNEKTFEQIARYNSVIGAETIVLTNGLQHITAKWTENGYQFIPTVLKF